MNFNDREVRDEISKILVESNLRTDQRAINRIEYLIKEARHDMFQRTLYSASNKVMEIEFMIKEIKDGLYEMTDQELDEWYANAIKFMKGK